MEWSTSEHKEFGITENLVGITMVSNCRTALCKANKRNQKYGNKRSAQIKTWAKLDARLFLYKQGLWTAIQYENKQKIANIVS